MKLYKTTLFWRWAEKVTLPAIREAIVLAMAMISLFSLSPLNTAQQEQIVSHSVLQNDAIIIYGIHITKKTQHVKQLYLNNEETMKEHCYEVRIRR